MLKWGYDDWKHFFKQLSFFDYVRLFSPRWHSCQMLFQTKNSLAIHMEKFHKKTSCTIIIHIGRYFSFLQCALSSCDFPCLNLETKALSHSARVWIWFEWRDCLCLASLSLEVNLSWHWSHFTLDLTVGSSLVLQGLWPTSDSLTTNAAM